MSTDEEVRAALQQRFGEVIFDSQEMPTKPTETNLPRGLDAYHTDLLKKLLKLPYTRSDLARIRHHYEGGKDAISSRYFPKPPRMTDTLWSQNKLLLSHVNLVRPSVRCWTSAVYGGESSRRVISNPVADVISPWLSSQDYYETVTGWIDDAVTYGTAVLVPIYNVATGELYVWSPDPVCTWIYADPQDVRSVQAIAEVKKESIQYMTLTGEGFVSKEAATHRQVDFGGFLPVAIAYGVNRLRRGEVYGLSLVQDSVDWSIRTTAVAYNVSLLQKQQTRAIMLRIGNLEMLSAVQEGGTGSKSVTEASDGGSMDLPEGFTAEFISPDPKIKESLDILKSFIGLLATATSIPQDVLDATLTESVSSAEAARIRAIPLVQAARQLLPAWRRNEQNLVLAATARVMYEMTPAPIDIAALRRSVQTEIVINSRIIPTSPNEETQDLIAQVSVGLKTAEDAIRQVNPLKSDAEITAMAEEMRKRQETAGSPQKLEQQILQAPAQSQAA